MSVNETLIQRSNSQCELCTSTDDLRPYQVRPSDGTADQSIFICAKCQNQIENPQNLDTDHWRCLNDSMWSAAPAVQVMSYRILNALGAQDLLDMMYLEEDVKAWADSDMLKVTSSNNSDAAVVHRDSNGTILNEGDTVTLIKDLEVKGAGFTAKRGTIVKNIHLTDDAKFIEGKINGTQIVLVAEYMKKSN
jgi:protein PhnA